MGSNSYSTPFCLEGTAFSCGHSIFADTATASDLQASNLVILTFATQKNGVRGWGG